ncbi:MAG: GGDEF domain-containing protein [Anaerocolumna sp.]
MKQEYVIKEFTVICNVTGRVEQVINYNSWDVLPEIGKNFSQLLNKDSQSIFKNFLATVKKQGYALDYILTITIDNITQPVCVNAFYKNHKFHISVLIGCQGTLSILKEIHRISNKQMSYKKAAKPLKEELNEYTDMLEKWVMRDPLTNLFNHRYFNSIIYKEAAKAHVTGLRITMIVIDFDSLKEFNDEFGYRKGDELLLSFVSIAQERIRKDEDILFRLGGDEFLILCPDQNQIKAYRLMEKINEELQLYTPYASISYGIVEILPEHMGEGFDVNFYFEEADNKIKQDKKNKKKYQLEYKI